MYLAKPETLQLMDYTDFIDLKRRKVTQSGFDADLSDSNLFPFQKFLVELNLKRGRSALFGATGIGKTGMFLHWADRVVKYTNKPVLIFAPLAVASQTAREGVKFGIEVKQVSSGSQITQSDIYVTNYDKLDKFYGCKSLGGVVLDESSIIKSSDGKFKASITEFTKWINYKLAATATPSPNDLIELSSHSAYLGHLSPKEIIALYFTQEGNSSLNFRLKNHAVTPFFEYLSQWAVAVSKPSDLGDYDDTGYNLPDPIFHQVTVESPIKVGELFATAAMGLTEQRESRRNSLQTRVAKVAEIVAQYPDESIIIWCDLNDESESLADAIPGAIEVRGSQSSAIKEELLNSFSSGESKVLISKPKICGFGLNWQHCNKVIFCGVSNSYEAMHQAIRRCWRYGQDKQVNVWLVSSESDVNILDNLRRKESQSDDLFSRLINIQKAIINPNYVLDSKPVNNTNMQLPSWLKSA